MRRRYWILAGLLLTIALGGVAFAAQTTTVILAAGLTTNTKSDTKTLPAGYKTVVGHIICSSGACTQTQTIYGDDDQDTINGVALCQITLSGTPRDDYACPVMEGSFPYYYVVTSNTTGTGATGSVTVSY